jgi:hypothetical protein
LNLAFFFDPQRAQPVIRIQRCQRLDEERLPARTRIVHDAGKLARELRLDRNHEPPFANRDDVILNHPRVLRRLQNRADAVARVHLRLR